MVVKSIRQVYLFTLHTHTMIDSSRLAATVNLLLEAPCLGSDCSWSKWQQLFVVLAAIAVSYFIC